MSSLKDIMDVDVEPLESQALRRSKEAAAQQNQSSQTTSSATRSTQSPSGDSTEQPSLKRRRSNRVSKSSSQGLSTEPTLARRRSSAGTTESMESYGGPPGGSAQSAGGSSRVSSRGSNPPESSVRYTPVTGRVSRAKKGQPVHICNSCDPPRIFTRAEHLRRHGLGHQKPAYPCTFEDCEKAFHRPDLLARHLNRHETQGEKPYKAGTRSRSSSASNSITPPLKVETPMRLDNAIGSPMSMTDSSTPHNTASTEGAKSVTTFDAIVPGFQAVNFSPGQDRTSGQFDGSGQSSSHGGPSAGPPGASDNLGNNIVGFSSASAHGMSQGPFVDMNEAGLNQMYTSQNTMFPVTSDGVPSLTLQVPDLAYGNSNTSPWYSSSDSTWSTPSEVSRFGNSFSRDRANSEATIADWGNQQSIPWSPIGNIIQTPRSALLETVPERFESPPYLSPHLSPRMISYPVSAVVVSPVGGYNMELVGTPTLTSPYKPRAQSFSAPRRTPRSKFTEFDGRDISMVDAPNLDRTASGTSAALAAKVDDYMKTYRTHLEPIYSIIHPETSHHHQSGLVRNAMAALGSQFYDQQQDREYGARLHESCTQRLTLQSSERDFQTMQAIFLTEVFARFRAKRPEIRFSYQFVGMYRRLVHDNRNDSLSRFTNLNMQTLNSLIDQQLEKHLVAGLSIDRQNAIEALWNQWVDYETRQRLRAACFILDVHQSMCFEQSRLEPSATAENLYLPYPCHQDLWNASSAQEWYNFILSANYSATRLANPEQLSRAEIFALPLSTQCLSLLATVALLPPKLGVSAFDPSTTALIHEISTEYPDFMCPHNYLTLYHTPVRKLLALTGKTWVLSYKITDHSEIDSLAPAIKKWVTEPSAAHATWHACQALHILLINPTALRAASQWYGTYTAILVIWAFGHRATSTPSSNMDRASRDSSITLTGTEEAESVKLAALAYLESMLALQPMELFMAPRRSDTNAVLDVVRWKLEADALPGPGRPRHAMLLDAVGVLQRLRDGGKWF